MLIFFLSYFLICANFFNLPERYYSFLYVPLDPIKPLVTKLQTDNYDLRKVYQVTESVAEELKNYRDDIDNEFQHWYDLAIR